MMQAALRNTHYADGYGFRTSGACNKRWHCSTCVMPAHFCPCRCACVP